MPTKSKIKSPRRERIPENLPVEKVVIDPPEVMAEPEKWRRIGEETSERLNFEPGHFFRRLLVRPKYVLIEDKEAAPIIVPLPSCLQELGIAAPGLDAVFHWETGRGAACLENIVPVNFPGVLQCDADAAYPAFASKREGIELMLGPCAAALP